MSKHAMWRKNASHDQPGSAPPAEEFVTSPPVADEADGQSGARSMLNLLKDALRLPPSIVISSFTINLLGLALPLVVLQVFDRVLRYEALNTLSLLIIGLICVVLAETTLRFARNRLIGDKALREGFALHMQGVTRFLKAPRAATAQLPYETSADAMSAIDEMGQFLSGNGRLALLDFPFIIVFLILIWAIAGPIVIVPTVLIIAFASWTVWSSANFKKLLNEQVQLERERFDFYSECLQVISTVKSLAIEPQMQRRLERIMQAGASVSYRLVLRSNRMISAGQFFASLTIISIVTVGGVMAVDGALTIGAVAACLLIANRVTQPVLRIIGVWGQMEAARLARERYQPLMTLPQTEATAQTQGDAISITLSRIAIAPAEGGPMPEGVSLTVKPKEVIAIVAPNFSDRAQLIKVLRGELQPDQGTLLIDDVDTSSPEGETLFHSIFFLGSSPDIFHGSILDNISMFRRVSHSAAIEMACHLGVEPVIQALPEGYHTRLGDIGAAALPHDIMQALCTVRAAALRPRALMLDIRRIPPDDVSTRACTKAIEMLRDTATIIIIGKHLSEVKDADRVLAIHDWQLKELPRALNNLPSPENESAPLPTVAQFGATGGN